MKIITPITVMILTLWFSASYGNWIDGDDLVDCADPGCAKKKHCKNLL